MSSDKTTSQTPLLELRGITKRFGNDVLANDNVNCSLRRSEIHAILGENGAGKTTLMKIIAGLLRPDSGEILIGGQRRIFRSPRDAGDAGIGMVHQNFSLVPALSVADNLALSLHRHGVFYRPVRWQSYLRSKATELGVEIRPEVPVWRLSVGERQRVEVFRLLLGGARVLVLDEPTSMFAPHEAQVLFDHLERFKSSGRSVFLVTHKIEHVMACADRVTVLRKGRVVAEAITKATDANELASMMMGNVVERRASVPAQVTSRGERKTVLELDHVSTSSSDSTRSLSDVSLIVGQGEIVGVAGVAGNGQEDLTGVVTGQRSFQGRIVRGWKDQRRGGGRGTSFLPSDRLGSGLGPGLSVGENLALKRFRTPTLSRGFFLILSRVLIWAKELINAFKITPSRPEVSVESLSGGNIQKVLLARELELDPDFLLAESPTAGLDLSMVSFVHTRLRDLSSQGCGVLLVSEDLDELLSMCDRIEVLFEGKIVGEFSRDEFAKNKIGLLMSGVDPRRAMPVMSTTSTAREVSSGVS